MMARRDYSEAKSQEIDAEVTEILHARYAEAKQLLMENRGLLDTIAMRLLERETLDSKELALLLRGEPLPPLPAPQASPAESAKAPKPERSKDFPGGKVPDPEPFPS